MKALDLLIIKIRNPTGSPKFEQKPFSEHSKFSANECRHLVYYSLIYILRPWLKDEKQIYYDHLLKFIFFMRLLSQKSVSLADIRLAGLLIEDYLSVFGLYYGEENLSFNLHCHQHYPMQVLRTGTLSKGHAFGFEGFFFISKKLHHGTRNIFGQTANNTVLKQKIYLDNNEFGDNEEEELMVEAEKCSIAKINHFAKTFFISLGNSKETLIEFSYKAIFKNESKFKEL